MVSRPWTPVAANLGEPIRPPTSRDQSDHRTLSLNSLPLASMCEPSQADSATAGAAPPLPNLYSPYCRSRPARSQKEQASACRQPPSVWNILATFESRIPLSNLKDFRALAAGDLLPTIQTLCQRYSVSRGTAHSAVKILTSKGFANVSRGRRALVTLCQPPGAERTTQLASSGSVIDQKPYEDRPKSRKHATEASLRPIL